MPRPFHVDQSVQLLDRQLPDQSLLKIRDGGAKTFWAALPQSTLEVTRKVSDLQYGFPSGHSSIAIAFWASVALLFRKKWVTAMAISLMVLIPLSRLYLGVHFLADVIGGIILGGIIFIIFWAIILKISKLHSFLLKKQQAFRIHFSTIFLLLSPFLLLPLLAQKVQVLAALLLGLTIGFLWIGHFGFPKNEASIGLKIGRILVAFSLFLLANVVFHQLGAWAGLSENAIAHFIANVLVGWSLTWLAVRVNQKIGWMKRHHFNPF